MDETEVDERLQKVQEYFETSEQLMGKVWELLRGMLERLDKLEQRVGRLELQYEQIPWLRK